MNKAVVLIVSLFFLLSCSNEDKNLDPLLAFGSPPTLVKVTKEQALKDGEEMFDDDESVDEIIAPHRFFYVHEPVKATVTSEGKIRLYNFMAHTFKNLDVWMVPKNLKDTIRLVQFEEVPPFYDIYIESPLKMGNVVYETMSGKPVMVNNLAMLSPSDYTLLVTVKDEVFNLLKSIKMKTRIQMGRYGEGNWGPMTPDGARYLACGAVNMAVLFSSQAFRDSLMAYPGLLPDNEGNPVDREKLISQILSKGALVMGLVKNYEGLGGGNAFGVGPWLLPKMYYQNRVVLECDWAVTVWTHELGHCIGYAHGSAMCYGKVDYEVAPAAYKYLIKNKLLPYVVDPYKKYNDYNPTQISKEI